MSNGFSLSNVEDGKDLVTLKFDEIYTVVSNQNEGGSYQVRFEYFLDDSFWFKENNFYYKNNQKKDVLLRNILENCAIRQNYNGQAKIRYNRRLGGNTSCLEA